MTCGMGKIEIKQTNKMKTEHKLTQNKWRLFMRQVCCISSTHAAPALCRVRPKVKTVLFSLGLSTLQPVHPVYYCSNRLSVFYGQKMWIFWPQNHHLAPIAQKKTDTCFDFTYIPIRSLPKGWKYCGKSLVNLFALSSCKKQDWHICGFSCLREVV